MYWVRLEMLACSFWVFSKASCNQNLKNTKIWSHSIAFHACSFLCFSSFCICYLWMRGRRDSLMTPLSKGEKIFRDVLRGENIKVFKKGGNWRIWKFWNLRIIVRGSFLFAFLWSYCPFWTWIAFLGSSQWSKVTLNNCSFIWTLSEIFDSSLEIEAFLLYFALSHLSLLFWSQLGHFLCFLLHLDQVAPLCENVEFFLFKSQNLLLLEIANVFIKGEIVDIMGICSWS